MKNTAKRFNNNNFLTNAEARALIKKGDAIAIGVSVYGTQTYHLKRGKRNSISIIYNNITDEILSIKKYNPPSANLSNSHLFIGKKTQ